MANTGDADIADGIGRGRGRGSQLLIKQNPNDAGYVVWGDFYFDAVAGGGVDGTITTSQAQSSSLALDREIGATTETGQGQSVAATSARSIDTTAAASQAQSTTVTAQRGIDSTTGTSQGQSSQATANGVLDGVIGSAQGQTVEAFADTAITVDAAVSTSQAQSVEGLASGDVPVDEGIQPIHGYNFDNDRRLLKARREKEKRDKLSFAEQLEAIKPQVVVSKTDTEAAIEFVERINALRPFEQPESKPIDLEFLADSRLRLSESEAEDEAIALIIAALL